MASWKDARIVSLRVGSQCRYLVGCRTLRVACHRLVDAKLSQQSTRR